MGVPFTQYPGGFAAVVPGPNSIFIDGILDFSSSAQPATVPKVDLCDCGKPKTQWPSITRVYKFSLTWTYTSRTLAESIITEFETLGLDGFDYDYPGDEFVYRCFWVNSPNIHPVEYTELWIVTVELIGVRL